MSDYRIKHSVQHPVVFGYRRECLCRDDVHIRKQIHCSEFLYFKCNLDENVNDMTDDLITVRRDDLWLALYRDRFEECHPQARQRLRDALNAPPNVLTVKNPDALKDWKPAFNDGGKITFVSPDQPSSPATVLQPMPTPPHGRKAMAWLSNMPNKDYDGWNVVRRAGYPHERGDPWWSVSGELLIPESLIKYWLPLPPKPEQESGE